MKQSLPFGCWQPAFELGDAFRQPAAPQYPQILAEDLYWLSVLPEEDDRVVLIRRHQQREECLLPAPYSIRSRVHEYGGRAHLLLSGLLIFVNHEDQRLYRLQFNTDASPLPLTPVSGSDGSTLRFADPVQISAQCLVAVAEYHRPDGAIENLLVAVNFLAPGKEPLILAHGADFYAGFACDQDSRRCAWIEWDHPDMQWDRSRLQTASLEWEDNKPFLKQIKSLIDEPDCSVYSPLICTDGSVVFAMDRLSLDQQAENFSNLYRYADGSLLPVTQQLLDIGEPFWVFGQNRYCEMRGGKILVVRIVEDCEVLQLIDLNTGALQNLKNDYVGFNQLMPARDVVLMTAVSDTGPPQIVALNPEDLQCRPLSACVSPLASAGISIPQAFHFAVTETENSRAWFYPPQSTTCQAPANSLPPLLVMVHGGPTSRSKRGFNLEKQIWTSLGFAVLDINHRGSSGYGRNFRQRLSGDWGIVEIDDVVAAIHAVTACDRADADKVFIRGGSAGGYTVLRALTEYPQVFAAGACYYGIANLAILAKITHKFEAYYLDRLLGEPFDEVTAGTEDNVYWHRSPIRHMAQLSSPMIVFQGLDDKVVPPELSQELVAQLQHNGVEYQYREYAGEGHGFRKAATRIDSLTREIAFYQHLLHCSDAVTGGLE